MTQQLPKFNRPPVVEVLCCVYFKDLINLHGPHLGTFWEMIGGPSGEYNRTQTAAPLPPVNIPFTTFISVAFQNLQTDQFQLPRTFFVNGDDTGLIQIQRDRLVFSWKQNNNENKYPSYDMVIKSFKKILEVFLSFVNRCNLDPLVFIGAELVYINHISYGDLLKNQSNAERVFPMLSWHSRSSEYFKEISELHSNFQFQMPNDDGRLQMILQNAQRRQDGVQLLRLDFIARKLSPEILPSAMWDWFDRAHERIVTSFADVTSAEAHAFWERHQ